MLGITPNCESALRRLRLDADVRRLWVDSICIDQNSLDERSQQVALMIILESSLSFIGAGAPATSPSWGSIVADGRDYVLTGNWWLTTFPGLAIALSVLAINFFGDGLRDVLDPRLRL